MKTAIVTGISGFIGSHIARALVRSGWCIHGLQRPTSDISSLKEARDKISFHVVDPTRPESVFNALPACDAVLHLATNYGRDGESSSTLLCDNTLFPLRLLEWTLSRGIPALINADTCFTPEYPYLRSYTTSKKQFTQWGEVLCATASTRFVNLKLQHPYGPGDRPGKFVPAIIRDCLNNVGNINLTPGEQKKDFVYIADVVDAFVVVLEQLDSLTSGFSSLDCGTGHAVSIRDFVGMVHRLTRSQAVLQFGALPYRDHEIMLSQANSTDLNALGWSAKTTLEEGLLLTIGDTATTR